MSIIWNIDKARPVGEPLPTKDAMRRADELEAKGKCRYTIMDV